METPEQIRERTLELLEQAKANLKPSKEKISEEEMQIITRFISERIFPFRKMERLGHPNRPKESNINKLRKRNAHRTRNKRFCLLQQVRENADKENQVE